MKKYKKGKISKTVQKKEKKERLEEFEKLYPKKKPYPNATVTEVRKNAIDVGKKGTRSGQKHYKKGDYHYLIDDSGIQATYLPSWKKRLKIFFIWSSKKRKWVLTTYRKGDW